MLEELRSRLSSLAQSATTLERTLADSQRIPPMSQARALVETERLQAKLAKLETILARSAGKSGP